MQDTADTGIIQVEHDLLSVGAACRMAALLDWPERPKPGDAIPAPWVWMLFQPSPTAAQTGTDGHPRPGGFLPDTGLPRRMWASSSVKQRGVLRIGEPLTRRSAVERVEQKSGRTGQLCFVTVRHQLESPGGASLEEIQTLVYREAATTPQAGPVAEKRADPSGFDWETPWSAEPVTLFRYSALTYNSHRIHYDLPYATDVEGYPGLVVHGPLMATVLFDAYCRRYPGVECGSWDFRALRPAFAGQPLTLCCKREDTVSTLRVLDQNRQAAFELNIR